MKLTLSWLKDHLDTSATLSEIAETMTRVGLEVERIEDRAADLAAFTIARVINAERHPNADKLQVCRVDTGAGEPVQVVCGAPNARAGMTSVFAPPGTRIPAKDFVLGIAKVRGVESRGMLCSAFELGLSDDHEGIIDLAPEAPVGAAYAEWARLGDPVIDFAVTPNRPDALGIGGVARDLAAAGLGTLIAPEAAPVAAVFPCPIEVTLSFDAGDRHLCPAFALRMVRGVRNGPSPDWLQRRLAAIGLRPINLLVDITNFITYDRGRPLHVFDAARVRGGLEVRRARAGESLLALDGRDYALDPETVVIADERGPESIAGIMGGEHSGCDETTTDVLIESALWDALNIARTGRRLGINSDARYRFERGVDPAFCLPGLELATRMVLDLCGGEPSEIMLAGAIPEVERVIDLPWSEVRRLTGLDLPVYEMRHALRELGFWVAGTGDVVKVAPPSWRPDVEGRADLVEEIVRIAGLDRVPSVPFPREAPGIPLPVLTPLQRRTRLAKRALAARGLVEAVTWSFVSRDQAAAFSGGRPDLALANPIAADLSDMRPSLLPGLIRAAQRNADRGLADAALFEVGQVFLGAGEDEQRMNAAALRRALGRPGSAGRHWRDGAAPVDAMDAKADALALLEALGVSLGGLQVTPDAPAWFHPGRSGTLRFGRDAVGAFGELHPRTLERLDAKGPLVAFEIVLDALALAEGAADPDEAAPRDPRVPARDARLRLCRRPRRARRRGAARRARGGARPRHGCRVVRRL